MARLMMIAAAGLLSLMLTACGDKDAKPAADTAQPAEAAQPAAAQPAEAAPAAEPAQAEQGH